MANKFAKDFSEGANHDFGSFTPKNAPKKDMSGAKESKDSTDKSSGTNNINGNNANNAGGMGGGQKPTDTASQTALNQAPGTNAVSADISAQKIGNLPPVQDMKRGIKADLKATATGEDPEQLEEEERRKGQSSTNVVTNALKKQAANNAGVEGGKVSIGKAINNASGGSIGSKFTGGLSALKSLGANAIGGLKGFFTTTMAGATKMGAIVGGALHVGTTAGTVIFLSTAVAAAAIPTVGGIGYAINEMTQRTDGCQPEEFDKQKHKGVEGALEWARAVANDDSFTYGAGDTAHHGGCYFCGTNWGPRKKMKGPGYEKTYCCNPFTISAYAHGAQDPDILKLCQRGGNAHLCWGTSKEEWEKYHFMDLGKPPLSELQDGDIGFWNGHQWLVGSVEEGTIIDASGGGWDANSISEKDSLESYYNRATGFMRYIGNGTGGGVGTDTSGVATSTSSDSKKDKDKDKKDKKDKKDEPIVGEGAFDEPDFETFDTSPLFASSDYNDEVARMTADDGCGDEMDGAEESGAYIGKGMKKVKASNGEEYIVLDADWNQVKKLGHQGPSQCYIYSIGYCDLILGGKFRCSYSKGETDNAYDAMRSAYGSGRGENGDPGNIGGQQSNVSSTEAMRKLAIEEIKQGRPVIFYVNNSKVHGSGDHWVCVCGWTANAGSDPKWNDLVCCDPAYAGSWGKGGGDGLRTMDVYPDHGGHTVATFKGWKPAKGQKKRSN